MEDKKKKKKKRKIKYKNLFIFISIILILICLCIFLFNIKITNIYIKNNEYYSDQEIIDMSSLHNYGKVITFNGNRIKKKLEKDDYIKKVKVYRSNLGKSVTIKVEENKPLLYYDYENKTLLADGTRVDAKKDVPLLINQVPKEKITKLLKKLSSLDINVLNRISEIKYIPSEVDEDLFYLTMEDGNYVYINFYTFKKLNNYVDILKSFDNKKGIVHLDSGDYLEVIK